MAFNPNYQALRKMEAEQIGESIHVQIGDMIAELCELEDQGEACGYTFPEMDLQTLSKKRVEPLMERIRAAIMGVLAGDPSEPVRKDPQLIIGSMLKRVQRWPASIPPRHKPSTPEDINAFIVWVRAPRRPPSLEAEL